MKKKVVLVFSVLFAVLLLYLLMMRIDREVLINSFQRIDWRFSAVGFFLYAVTNILRVSRFQITLDHKVRLRDMAGITFIHNFLINLLPFRTGEFSYPYLLRRQGFGRAGESTASLIASRLFDILVVTNLILFSFVFVLVPLAISMNSKAVLWIFAGALLLLSLFLIFFIEHVIFVIERLFGIIHFQGFHFFSFLMTKIDEARRVFLFMKSRSVFFRLLFLSLLIWLFNFLVGIFLLRSVGIVMSFWQVVFVFAFPIILSEISPVQSFANLGIYEWSLVGGMLLLGISQDIAAVASISVHLQELLFAGVLAFVGSMILLHKKEETKLL